MSMSGFESSNNVTNIEASRRFPLATPQHRLGGYFLDLALFFVTLFIGWFIWSLVIWGQGLTPAKQILKMRVYDDAKNRPVSWGHMALRQFVIPMSFYLAYVVLLAIAGANIYAFNSDSQMPMNFAVIIIYFAYLAFCITDAFWVMRPGNKRLMDVYAKTHVVNEAN